MPKDLMANLMSENIISIIKKFMIFKNIDTTDIRKILNIDTESNGDEYLKRIAKLCQYNKGETVIHEGAFDSWSFWVVKGVFNVIQNDDSIATFTKPGEIFGEMSVFEGIPRTASVVSLTKGICLCIDMSIIDTLNDNKIEALIKKGFYSVILKRVRKTKNKIKLEKKNLDFRYTELLKFEKKIKKKAKPKSHK
jgi:CRP-like cAMP-binding protein